MYNGAKIIIHYSISKTFFDFSNYSYDLSSKSRLPQWGKIKQPYLKFNATPFTLTPEDQIAIFYCDKIIRILLE